MAVQPLTDLHSLAIEQHLRLALPAPTVFGFLSAVGFAAVPDEENANNLASPVETYSIIADAKAVLGWVDALKLFYVARPGCGERSTACLRRRAIPLSSAAISCSAESAHSISLTPAPL